MDDILERKKASPDYKTTTKKKSKNWDFSKGLSPWFLSKKKKFFHLFILGKIGQENVLDDILERKKLLQTLKQRLKKVEKLGFFQRG